MPDRMINALIVDDEQHCIDHLTELLRTHASAEVRILGAFVDAGEASHAIASSKPDLLFLDIQLKDRTGFDLLNQIDSTQLSVIFTTAYNQYAVQAFRFSAVDYLLKPIASDELLSSLQKVSADVNKRQLTARYEILLQHLNQPTGTPLKIALPSMEGWDFIPVSEIIRCQAQGNYTLFFLQGGRQLMVSQTLKGYENLLEGHGFFRVHHAHLINLSRVTKYHKSGWVTLDDGSTVDVSTRRRDAFITRMTMRRR